jgi:Cu/Ag efflux protein CusF
MRIAGMIVAATAAFAMIASSALAQEARNGMVTRIDRISGTIAVQQTPDGTVGANTGAATEQFKTQSGLSLEALHVGDRITYSVAEAGGVKTITKFEKKK